MTTKNDNEPQETGDVGVQPIVLLPCPFCGSSDLRIVGDADGFTQFVSCENCQTTGPSNPNGSYETSQRDVVNAWNQRVTRKGAVAFLAAMGMPKESIDEMAKRLNIEVQTHDPIEGLIGQ